MTLTIGGVTGGCTAKGSAMKTGSVYDGMETVFWWNGTTWDCDNEVVERTNNYLIMSDGTIVYNENKEIENRINEVLKKYDKLSRGYKLCFTSPTLESIIYNGEEYNCYSSIQTAINTEYALITWEIGLCVVVLDGTYTENVKINGRTNVALIGLSNQTCVLQNYETSEIKGYFYPPLWINPSTTVCNLKIMCFNAYEQSEAYSIHSDDEGNGRVIIQDCVLYNEQHACIGFGTRENAPLYIINCQGSGFNKCLYGHNDHAGNSLTYNEELHVIGCYFRSGTGPCLDIFDANHYYPNGGGQSLDWLVYMEGNEFINGINELPPTVLTTGQYHGTAPNGKYFDEHIRKMQTNRRNNARFANYIDIL